MRLKSSRGHLLGLLVAASAHILTAFHATCQSRPFGSARQFFPRYNPPASLHLSLKDTPTQVTVERKGTNRAVRAILHYVQQEYPGIETSSLDWRRFRNYLYRTSERLSLDQVKLVLDYLEEIFPDDEELRLLVLKTSPRILGRPVDTFLRPTVDFLKGLYGSELFTQAIRRNQNLLLTRGVGYNAGSSSESVSTYLADELGLSVAAITALKRKEPTTFQKPLGKLVAVVSFLDDLMQHGKFTPDEIQKTTAKLFSRYPTLFSLSVPNKLQPQLEHLERLCHMQKEDIAKILVSKSKSQGPFLLIMSVEQNLKPSISYLSQIVSVDAVKQCIVNNPGMLSLAVHNIQRKVEYFDSIDPPLRYVNGTRVPSVGLAARVMIRAPSVYSTSLSENIMPKVAFLAGVWGVAIPEPPDAGSAEEFDRELGKLLGGMPSILTLSLEGNIQPTFKFYNSTGYITLDQDWKLSKTDGAARILRGREIGVSLFARLLPRWHFVRTKFENSSEPLPSPLIALDTLVGSTDVAFCAIYGASKEEYEEFKAEAIPRLKFSSQFDTWLKTGRAIELD